MIDSTHNLVSNYFFSDGKKASLFSILIRDPLTGKGLPIAWAFTGSSAETLVHNILRWLRKSTGVVPQAVMSNCNLAISNAVEAAYSDLWDQAPKHYWCLFHVMKAFKENAKSHLKGRADEALTDLRGVVYSQTDMTELRLELFCGKWNRISPSFVDYVRRQWDNRAKQWGLFYQTPIRVFTPTTMSSRGIDFSRLSSFHLQHTVASMRSCKFWLKR
ncbi:hypothetical protein PCANC_27779 [Puccinia coronata f. sp. avenae]|uniref:MULE transposase domain-containing protein n=1 Tax=Puccinia coronata f. sp. avenae TaxID=200324 RepID=A0A2N5S2Z2_9BASI|nr:hypothetical protein PCANC_27779 [Puccinia coronata f. sp. avenae]